MLLRPPRSTSRIRCVRRGCSTPCCAGTAAIFFRCAATAGMRWGARARGPATTVSIFRVRRDRSEVQPGIPSCVRTNVRTGEAEVDSPGRATPVATASKAATSDSRESASRLWEPVVPRCIRSSRAPADGSGATLDFHRCTPGVSHDRGRATPATRGILRPSVEQDDVGPPGRRGSRPSTTLPSRATRRICPPRATLSQKIGVRRNRGGCSRTFRQVRRG